MDSYCPHVHYPISYFMLSTVCGQKLFYISNDEFDFTACNSVTICVSETLLSNSEIKTGT